MIATHHDSFTQKFEKVYRKNNVVTKLIGYSCQGKLSAGAALVQNLRGSLLQFRQYRE